MNIVMLDRSSLPCEMQINKFSQPHRWTAHENTSIGDIVERCEYADILILSKVPINSEILARCPRIKHIAVAATGFNIVDIAACRKHGVSVSNIPSYAATAVAEHVISVTLALLRELVQYRARVIAGDWRSSAGFCLFDKPIRDLNGATIGIVGFGEIGKMTAQLANAMGMNVIFCARQAIHCEFATQTEFKTLLRESDVISLHCSLNDSSYNLIGASELKSMKSNAILINTARGGIVNEEALRDAVLAEDIAGVAVDVLRTEPPAENSPLLEIADHSNVIITPHISWTSQQSLHVLAAILVDNINAFVAGIPQNLVT